MRLNEEKFDLSKFLPESLHLDDHLSPSGRREFKLGKQTDLLSYIANEDPLKLVGETVEDWKPLCVDKDVVGTPIQEFFRDTNVFITGGTGYVGKVLFQKLIRSVPHIGQVYLLIRPKKGKLPEERLAQLLEDKLFLRMKTEVPHYLSKISVVEGDLCQPGLGLSPEAHKLLCQRIHVVFHGAADVRFIEPLRSSITSNVLGSKRVLDLARQFKNLKSYVHVSTAYSHCVRRVVEEKCYQMSVHYKDILKYIETKTDEEVAEETDRLMEGWPNTYTFGKALCENMIVEEAGDMPVCIYRPTIVWPTHNDPVVGYTDNVYGPTGMLLGVAMGVIHIYKNSLDQWLDCVPVDLVVNSLIAVATETTVKDRNDPTIPVYNFSATPQKPMTWKLCTDVYFKDKTLFPFPNSIWYISVIMTASETLDSLGHVFLHEIPGKILDKITELAGHKPRLSRVYEKIKMLKGKLDFFVSGVWEFENDNITRLWNRLEPADQELFPFDISRMEFDKYLLLGKLGLRYFFLKEKMETLEPMTRRHKWLKWAHYSLLSISGLIALKTATLVAHMLPI